MLMTRHPLERFLSSYRDKIELGKSFYFHNMFGEPDFEVDQCLDWLIDCTKRPFPLRWTSPSLWTGCLLNRSGTGIGTGSQSTIYVHPVQAIMSLAGWRHSRRTPSTLSWKKWFCPWKAEYFLWTAWEYFSASPGEFFPNIKTKFKWRPFISIVGALSI